MKIQKVTLIGLGAMGAFFAPKLNAFLGKANFKVMADGARKQRLESQGIIINGTTHHFTVVSPEEQGDPADLIIIAVKDTGLHQAISDIKNQVGEHTQILSVLNGVDSEERVAAVYGWDRVLYSYMRVSINMRDGIANFNPDVGSIHFGEAKNPVLSERVQHIKALFDACGIKNRTDADMLRGIWFKFMCNVGENLTCALLGVPFGAYQRSEHANLIRRQTMWEVIKIANALGINLGEADIAHQEKTLYLLPFNNKPSTLQDLEKGRATEVEMFAGKVIKLGQQLGIETPLCWMLYHGIRVCEEKNAGMFTV